MKIGVDVRVLMDEHYSGVSEYTANLLMALLAKDTVNEYRLFYNSFQDRSDKLSSYRRDNTKLTARHIPNKIFNYLLQKIFAWPKLDQLLGGVDVFWSPHFNFTSLSKSIVRPQQIITVHDLSFLRYPEFFSRRKNFWHQSLPVYRALKEADTIVAVSKNTKNDIVELAGIDPDKIKVVYSGNNLSKREVNQDEADQFLSKHNLSGRLILYLGNIEPRKNIASLIAAFNILKTKRPTEFKDVKLVLAGASGWKNRKIYQTYKRSQFKNDIIFLGYISKKEREVIYSVSSIFAYPSYYEGFGFPPLEAMTYGLPVVCSNVSSLPEVVADAALTVNPFSEEELGHALELMLTDSDLRQRFITRGYKQAVNFSWDKTASAYLQIFQESYGYQENTSDSPKADIESRSEIG